MVKIRLTRGGAKKRPFWRVIAIDERKARDGRPLEFLGTYDPLHDPARTNLKIDRIDHWVSRGAQVSPTVHSLVRKARRAAAATPAGS